MKVQILALDPQDDRASIADRLNWAQAPRVLLVWPRSGRPRLTRLDLAVLQRRARGRGITLGLATTDPDLRDLARDLGIPVFDTPDGADELAWEAASGAGTAAKRAARRRPTPPDLRLPDRAPEPTRLGGRAARALGRWLLFALALASVVAVAAIAWPAADITLSPATQAVTLDLDLTLDPQADAASETTVPAQTAYAVVEGAQRAPTTGAIAVASTRARTTVMLTNLTDELIVVPQGTGLRTASESAARFVTLESVALEPRAVAPAEAEAAEPGPQANLPAGAITLIEGALGLRVSVENPEPAAGGEESLRTAVALEDVRSAERQLRARLLEQAADQVEAGLPEGMQIAPASARVARELERRVEPEVGEPADSLEVALEAEVALTTYARTDLERAVEAAWVESSPDAAAVPGSQRIEILGGSAPDSAGRARLRVRTTREVMQPIDGAALARSLRGLAPADAAALLTRLLDLDRPPEIRMRPAWFPRLPLVSTRIALHWPWEAAR